MLFAEIGDIRSLLPKSINILALTATATKETLKCVTSRLSLEDPAVIGLPPDRPNIKYVVKPVVSILELCNQFCDELILKRMDMPKTILFCRSLQHCATFFVTMKRLLGKNLTEPPGIRPTVGVCLVDVFTSVSTNEMREVLLKEICKPNTTLRLLIATTAFGLGVDCPDIERVVNYGSPRTLEELVQESGRAGRDGRQAEAVLYPRKIGKKASTSAMEEYEKNNEQCQRKKLFKEFLFSSEHNQLVKACECCDFCAHLCFCDKCC